MARRFNPLEREPAILALPNRDFQVAEATRAIMRRVSDLQKKIGALDDDEDSNEDTAVALFAELIEAALVDGDGAAKLIVDAWHDNKISLPALVRTAEFIASELRGSVEAGEA